MCLRFRENGIAAAVNHERFRSTWETNKPLHFKKGGGQGLSRESLPFIEIKNILKKAEARNGLSGVEGAVKIMRREDCSNFGKAKPVLDAISRSLEGTNAETSFHLSDSAFKAGFSLTLSNLENYIPQVRQVTTELQKMFMGLAYANWYLSPPGGCAFAPHNDVEDNFIVQLEGEKRWRVYNHSNTASIDLVNYRKYNVPAEKMILDTVALDVVLKTGDVLFVPRGMYHEASVAEGANFSSHITYATACNIYWGLLFQYVISSAATRSNEDEASLRAQLDETVKNGSDITWLAMLIGMVEQATATNIDLRRRIALDSLAHPTADAKAYINHLVTIVASEIRPTLKHFFTRTSSKGTLIIDDHYMTKLENGTRMFNKEQNEKDVKTARQLLDETLGHWHYYDSLKNLETAQSGLFSRLERKVTRNLDVLRCDEAKTCSACANKGCSWCVSHSICTNPRDTCGADANAVGILGGHPDCAMTNPINATFKVSMAQTVCESEKNCFSCLASGCLWDMSEERCRLTSGQNPVVGSSGVYQTCSAFYDMTAREKKKNLADETCHKHDRCDQCINNKCAWCLSTQQCTPEGSMICNNAKDEVSRFDGFHKTCDNSDLPHAPAVPRRRRTIIDKLSSKTAEGNTITIERPSETETETDTGIDTDTDTDTDTDITETVNMYRHMYRDSSLGEEKKLDKKEEEL